MATEKKGQIQIFAKNIIGNASGGILEESRYTKNVAGGRHIQNGKTGGVNHDVNQPRKENSDLRVLKVEGPFDENKKLVDSIEKGKWYLYKVKFNKTAEDKELIDLKWASEYDENGNKKLLANVSNKGQQEIYHQVLESSTNLRLRIYAYFDTPKIYTKAEIIQGEILIVVGTEQHSQTYGNKLMFPAQAVRDLREHHKDHKHTNIIIFKDGFTPLQLSIIKRDARKWNGNLYFKQINSVQELIDYINSWDKTVDRKKVKISVIKIYAHGLPSIFDFGLDGDNEETQRFKINNVTQLKKEVFYIGSEIYSYACRTGNSDSRINTARTL